MGRAPKRPSDNPAVKERQEAVKARVEALDAEALQRHVDALGETWLFDSATFAGVLQKSFEAFGISPASACDFSSPEVGDKSYGLRAIDDAINENEQDLIAVHQRAVRLGLPGALLTKVFKCLEQLYYSKKIVLAAFQRKLCLVSNSTDTDYELNEELDARMGSWSLRFRWIDDDTTEYQKLLLFLFDQAVEKNYRKHGEQVYEPVLIGGHHTHAWKRVFSVETWVHDACRKELNLEQWKWMTQGRNAKQAIDHLTDCQDHSFPVLNKNRSCFAFLNGVYFAADDSWHPLGQSQLSTSVVAAKFFETFLEQGLADKDHTDIPTPLLDSILDYQGFPEDVKHWVYISLGRLLYDVGEKDNWQVIPYFKGQAGSGKSTLILHIAKRFYEDLDVGVLSNNIERKFGLSAFVDKLLFIAPEIKSDLKLEQAEFQQIVSGEDVTINTKNVTAYAKKWTAPGVMAGNEIPGWMDNAASLQRRFLLFDFPKTVDKADSRLGQKLEAEIPRILIKCNKAYLDAVRRWGDGNIWQVLPQYFKEQRHELAQITNAVEGFIGSGAVVFAEDRHCPMEDFKMALQAFMQQNNYPRKMPRWDMLRGPLESRGVTKKRETREYNGSRMCKEFLRGVDLAGAGEEVSEI